MVADMSLYNVLNVWNENIDSAAVAGRHLDDAQLYRLAEAGGADECDSESLEHLSLCPRCQGEWIGWLESRDILNDEQEQENPYILAAGFLKAASASLFAEPISLESSCGRFELSVYPELDNRDRGMVTLEVRSGADEYETQYCVVRDGRGIIILRGMIDDARIAGRIESLSDLDLKTWTVIVSGS